MPIPDFESIMLPLLKFANDGKEYSLRETREALAKVFKLRAAERKTLLPSGQQSVFDNRVGWALTYLRKAGLLETTRRGYYRITERGQVMLRQNPSWINQGFLQQFPEFVEFKRAKGIKPIQNAAQVEASQAEASDAAQTPEEVIEAAYQKLRQALEDELLQMIKERSPEFFERLVIDLLVNMGYGGTREDAGAAIGGAGDGGIDGIIKEDRLGLDIVYVQAKRWAGVVGRPEIQKFAGALQGRRAKKGIFLTTSDFSKDALDYAKQIDSRIVLIDGHTLAQLMIDHNVGVAVTATYELKRVDSDYFTEVS